MPPSTRYDGDRADDTNGSQGRLGAVSGFRITWRAHLESVVASYAADRGISGQQLTVLKLYLQGKHDKEIAHLCQCSVATVYEHWRRMARKLGASHKSDVVADFHRFLAGD